MPSGGRSLARTVLTALGALVALAFAVLLYECNAVNDRIDRCDDDSSDKYITDEAKRLKECGHP